MTRALCSDCGRPMMLDHTVCFSDDCVRQRREDAATALDHVNGRALRFAVCNECGSPLATVAGPKPGEETQLCEQCDIELLTELRREGLVGGL